MPEIRRTVAELIRFYLAGAVNAAFGFGLYFILIQAGLNLFFAQLLSHLAGMAFNFFMFQRHVFRDATGSVLRYLGTYAANYGLSLPLLAGFHWLGASDVMAGLFTIIAASVVNYVMLRLFVFKRHAPDLR